MANKTTNYKLTKPLESEFYDVGVHRDQRIRGPGAWNAN